MRTITNKMADALGVRKMSSDWPILTKLCCKLLRGCYTQAACFATLRKVEGRSTFLATRNATIAVAKWGLNVNFFLQLATQGLLRCKLQEKLLRVTWP